MTLTRMRTLLAAGGSFAVGGVGRALLCLGAYVILVFSQVGVSHGPLWDHLKGLRIL